jgi:hypothetical protein
LLHLRLSVTLRRALSHELPVFSRWYHHPQHRCRELRSATRHASPTLESEHRERHIGSSRLVQCYIANDRSGHAERTSDRRCKHWQQCFAERWLEGGHAGFSVACQ